MSKLIKDEFIIEKSSKWSAINLTAIEDPHLSPTEKFIHTYLVSRPPGWEIRIKDIIKRSTVGRDAIYNGLKKLIDAGYIHREAVYSAILKAITNPNSTSKQITRLKNELDELHSKNLKKIL